MLLLSVRSRDLTVGGMDYIEKYFYYFYYRFYLCDITIHGIHQFESNSKYSVYELVPKLIMKYPLK